MTSQKFIGTFRYVPNGYGYVTLKGDVGKNAVVVAPFPPGVFDGDTVEITAAQNDQGSKNDPSLRCRITKVIERAQTFVIGEYRVSDQKAYVIPDSYIPFRIQVKQTAGGIKCENGDKVAAVILKYKVISAMRVEITENFGRNDTFGANFRAAVYGTPLFTPFGEEAERQVSMLRPPEISKLLAKRVDFRGKTVFTFADSVFGSSTFAFSLSQTDYERKVGLHILDIDEFVSPSSPLDTEAYRRGRSVCAERDGSPMFPRSFTTSIGTFEEKHASPALSVFVTFDADGNAIDTEFCESVVEPVLMTSDTDIDALFSGSDSSALLPLRQKYGIVLDLITSLYDLSGILRRRRLSRGGVDFDVAERMFGFDSEHRIRHLSLDIRSDSYLMVNEILIAVGSAAAEYLYANGVKCVFSSLAEQHYDSVTGIPSSKVLLPEIDYTFDGYTKREASAVKGTGLEKFCYIAVTDECTSPKLSFVPDSHFVYKTNVYANFFHPADSYACLVNLRAVKAYLEDVPFDIRAYSDAIDNEMASALTERKIRSIMSVGYLEENVGKIHSGVVIKRITGGFRVMLDCGLLAFLPTDEGSSLHIGKPINATVAEADYSSGRIVLNIV